MAVGGRAEAIALDPEADAPGHSAPRRPSGATMAGVDLLARPDARRLVVLEVNAVPGWRALAAATGVDVAAAVLRELLA